MEALHSCRFRVSEYLPPSFALRTMHINAQVVIQHSRGPSGFIYNDLQWFYIFITFFEVLGVGGWWVDLCWWFMGAAWGHLFYAPSWASASWASWVRAASMLASPGSWEKEVFFRSVQKAVWRTSMLSCLKILKLSHFKPHLDVPWMSLIPRHTSWPGVLFRLLLLQCLNPRNKCLC